MHALLRDVRYGFRSLLKNPGLTIVSVFALTLGIGLTTTMFSIVYGALLKGLPYPDGDRIMVVNRANPARGITRQALPIQDYVDYKAQQHDFTELAAMTSGTIVISGDYKAERFDGSWVTANIFTMVGVQPVLGRNFRAGEDTPTGAKVAIISYSNWRDRYNRDPGVIGRRVRVNGEPYTLIGVMPDGFAFPNNDKIWVPLQTDPLATPRGQGQYLQVVGKLAPGVTLDRATVDLTTIAKRLAVAYPEADSGFTARVNPFVDSYIGPQPRQLLFTMLGAVFFVLLIACANVANLLLDRAAHRTKEVGIRTALGASRGAVVRQFLTESLILSLAATALGIVVAHYGIVAFNSAITVTNVPFFIDIRLHPAVLGFTILVAFATTLISGAIPAYQSSRADLNEILKDESRGASSFRIGRISKALVMFEIALSCGLLVAAGLTIKSVVNMQTMDPGFTTKDVFTARMGFPASYTDTLAQWRFFDQVVDRVAGIPGVKAAAISSGLPAARSGLGGNSFGIEGQTYLKDKDYPASAWASITPDFFTVLNTPILQGRAFTTADRAGALPVVIVNRAFVDKYYNGENPLGRRIRLGTSKTTAPWLTIVGVVNNTFTGDQDNPMAPVMFQPFAQARTAFVYIAARTAGPPLAVTQGVRDAVSALNNDIPLYWVLSLDEAIAQSLWFVRVFGFMFMIFGLVALFLASVGLYAVMAFAVSRRTREVGIRMALGAQARDVVRLIVGQGALQLGVGMTIGIAFAFGIAQLLKIILFQVQPRDPTIFGGVAGVLILVGIVACLVPARRATRVDPLVALRSD
ncbi:MAG TPA: ABC transporter permease [Gemmatimonadaceae bacterium]|nr:ABC transporter permease [Gemmatimonadaceae bacterium]